MANTRRMLLLGAMLTLPALAATGCSGAFGPPPSVCVPELRVEPENPRPGGIVTVTADRTCPTTEGMQWILRLQPDDARTPLAQAVAHPDVDGAFSVEITVPPTMPPGRAIVWITNYWDALECPGGASCASAEGYFTVAP